MKKMSKMLTIAMAAILVFSLMTPAMAAEGQTATPFTTNLTVDGKTADCAAYTIGGSNYFKLRDLAALLNGTAMQFEVGFDVSTQSVSLTSGKAYTSVGGELAAAGSETVSAAESSWKLAVDGHAVSRKMQMIGWSNYVTLQDLGTVLGFKVDYASDANTAVIAPAPAEAVVTAVCDGSATYKIEAEGRDFMMGFDGDYFLDDYFGTDIKAGVEALIQKGSVTVNDRATTIDEVTQALKSSGTNITLTVEKGATTKMNLFSTAGVLVDEVKKNADGTVTINGNLTVPAANVADGVEPYVVCVYWEGADGMHIQPADKLTGKLVKSDDHAGVIINIDGKDVNFAGADMYQRNASAGNRPGGYANTTDRLDLEEYELTAWLIPGTKDTDNPMIIAFTTGTPEKASARLQGAIDFAQNLVDMTVIAESAEDAAAKTNLKEYHWLKAEDTAVLDGLKEAIAAAKAVLADKDATAQKVDDTAYDLQIAVWGSNSDVSAVFMGTAKDGYFDKADGGEHALPAAVLF